MANLLTDIQTKYKKFYNDEIIGNILKKGAENARIVANETLSKALTKLGLK